MQGPTLPIIFHQLHPAIKKEIEEKHPEWITGNVSDLRQHFFLDENNKLDNKNALIIGYNAKVDNLLIINELHLSSLFRGSFDPGELGNTKNHKYMYIIQYVESLWTAYANQGHFPIPRDKEMEEIYSQLRRRPDSPRNFSNPLYGFIWQLFAFMAITIEISEAEFHSILSRLTRSARTFCTSTTSTNMYTQLLALYAKILGKSLYEQ